jgi:hypothetical protein
MSGKISSVLNRIDDLYPVWRLRNLGSSIQFRQQRQKLSAVEQRVLDDLNRNGIAITHVDELFADPSVYHELLSSAETLEQTLKETLDESRKNADAVSVKKDFVFQLLGDRPELDPNDVNVRFALQTPILNIVNSYFGCLTKLKFFNIWHTFISKSGPKRSMFWHRDPEDKWIIKVFMYLNDVDEGAGPFTYAPATHPKGVVKKKPEWFKEAGRSAERSTDEQMEKVVTSNKWITAMGKKGTIIFADTKGYHKGGQATSTERIMYNCLFVSPASKTGEVFERKKDVADVSTFQKMNASQQAALI